VNMHSTQTTMSSRNGAIALRKASGSVRMFLWTRVSPFWFRMQTYMERACRSIPQ
jgi:hypothetical protein